MSGEFKRCPKCGESKPKNSDYFHRSKQTKDGLRCWCKTCQKAANLEFNRENPDKAVKRTMRCRNKEEYRKKAHVDNQTKYFNTEKGKVRYKDTLLKTKYSISLDEYNTAIALQGGGCAICGKTVEEEGKYLAVDHCHDINKVRGILCQNCNQGIGKFKDSLILLDTAYNYLRSFYETLDTH